MSESDDNTLAFYDAEAASYADAFTYGDPGDSKYLKAFIAALPSGDTGASVCDLGSGNGWASAALRDAGYTVTALDGSAGLAAEAKKRHDIDVQVMRFEDFAFVDTFDGVWAAWSLHHARRETFPALLGRVGASLKTNGLLFLAMKGGSGEKRDDLDRLYSYYEMDELKGHIAEQIGAEILLEHTSHGSGFDGSTTPLHGLIVRKTEPS